MSKIKSLLTFSVSTIVATSMANAALSAVFEYTFPESYSGGGSILTDQSGAGNNGTIDSPSTGGYLASDRPSSFTTGGSLTGSTGGHGVTDGIDLLDNTLVQTNGGFTMETWFRWEGVQTNTRKLIDYAGTEYLATQGPKVRFVLSNGGTSLEHAIVANQWYHVVAEFDTQGNLIDGGNGSIAGEARLYVDGTLVGTTAATKTAQGDNLNRGIGINRWAGGGGDWNQGAIYNPSVYLGVVPEPSSSLLIGVGLLTLAIRRHRK